LKSEETIKIGAVSITVGRKGKAVVLLIDAPPEMKVIRGLSSGPHLAGESKT
jgi:hypothetical protein